jgi:hypothetical protein
MSSVDDILKTLFADASAKMKTVGGFHRNTMIKAAIFLTKAFVESEGPMCLIHIMAEELGIEEFSKRVAAVASVFDDKKITNGQIIAILLSIMLFTFADFPGPNQK